MNRPRIIAMHAWLEEFRVVLSIWLHNLNDRVDGIETVRMTRECYVKLTGDQSVSA